MANQRGECAPPTIISYRVAVAGLLLAFSSVAAADAQVIYAYAFGNPRIDGGKVVGVSFSSLGGTISSLGFYDSGDGLSTSYQVGLWDSSQNLVRSATVTPSSPKIGDFRYAAILPITIGDIITPQTFTIGALLPPVMADVWLDNVSQVLGVGYFGAGLGQYQNGGALTYPGTFDSTSYYVVNGGGEIPEPNSLALGSLGVAAWMVQTMRRRAARLEKRK